MQSKIYRSKLANTTENLAWRPDFVESEDIPSRKYKRRTLSKLNFDEKRGIIIDAILEKLAYKDIARKFKVSVTVV